MTAALELLDVSRHYRGKGSWYRKGEPVRAVDGVDIELGAG